MRASITLPVILCLLLFLFSCRKPWAPPVTSTDLGYLVVEGVINSGSDSTLIKLSRTIKLNSSARRPETGAKVIVESDQNASVKLTETANGSYVAVNLNLPENGKYRLHIYTAANKEYISDFVENKITPAIDSISYKILEAGVQFYVNAHDPSNNTKFYRWEYGEAWTYYSAYPTVLAYENGAVVGRSSLDTPINYCYKFAVPDNNVFISTSDKLSRDVIYQYPLGYTAGSSGKLEREYGLTVRQYALTPDAYKYWQLLKTNTEQLGTIFDAQPSTSITNLHSITNPAEPVIGYMSVSTIAIKRIFLRNIQFPFSVTPTPPVSYKCVQGIMLFAPTYSLPYRLKQALGAGDSLLTDFVYDPKNNPIGYKYAASICVDCRLSGGTTAKPSYWPY